MAVAIKIDQAGKPAGVAGIAREDIDVGTAVTLTATGGPFSAYQWTVLGRPVDIDLGVRATAVCGSPTSSVTSLSPIDVDDTYYVQVAVNSGSGLGATAADIARLTFYAGIPGDKLRGEPNADPRLFPRRWPAVGEKGEHTAVDAVDVGGNQDGWAREMVRIKRVLRDMFEGKTWASGRVALTSGGAVLTRGYNVASVVRTAQGVVLVTFDIALPDTSYSVIGSARSVGGGITVSSELSGSCVIERGDVGGSLVDAGFNFRVELGV